VNRLGDETHIPALSRRGRAGAHCFFIAVAMLAGAVASGFGQTTDTIHSVANMFDPMSTPARQIHEVSLLVLLICTVIFLVVTGLLVFTVLKFRRRGAEDDHEEPPQIYGSSQIELAWTVLPILITVVLVLVTARTIGEIQDAAMPANALNIRVVGHQWWWEARYEEYKFVTANEIHIPLSTATERRVTHVALESADVIHSFWVPQLNGKTDLVPNRTNELWLEPHTTGIFLGNCAEYCGAQHANMQLRVVVHPPGEFEEWVKSQQATPPLDPAAAKGRALFVSNSCVNCHTVDGTVANGIFGPDLTHLMTRQTIGAGVAPNDTEHLRSWVRDPQILKAECLMPDMKLLDSEVDAIVAYLQTLR